MNEAERRLLQRRIKNQRAELRRLNRIIIDQNQSIRYWIGQISRERINAYRHAAQIAEGVNSFWMGQRIATAIRRWL